MKYDFDSYIERQNTSSFKWDCNTELFGREDILPMWVADMDFKMMPEIADALRERVNHGVLGYTDKKDPFYEALIGWEERRHGWKIEKDWLKTSPGVVSGISMAIQAFTHPGDKVIIQPPVYYPFSLSIVNNGRYVVENPLIYENGTYKMDFEDLEKKFDCKTKLLILCNPHNPVGRVWGREELEKLAEICLKHKVTIISDEIHCDLVYSEGRHIPFATLSDKVAQNTVTFIAPSKTFNLAGLQTSAVIIPNESLRRDFCNVLDSFSLSITNVFGVIAFQTAYNKGDEWVDELIKYLEGNRDYLVEFMEKRIPKLKTIKTEGTYLAWIDCSGLKMSKEELRDFMINRAKLGLDDGYMFGKQGEQFQRINFGCPRSILKEALERLEKAVSEIE